MILVRSRVKRQTSKAQPYMGSDTSLAHMGVREADWTRDEWEIDALGIWGQDPKFEEDFGKI